MGDKKAANKPTTNQTKDAGRLQEAHGDWVVLGTTRANGDATEKVCAIVQEQTYNENDKRQRLLRAELRPEAGGVTGVLVLPFGLLFQRGVVLQIDEGLQAPPRGFRTAMPLGCIVDIKIDAENVAHLKQGKTLHLHAIAADTGKNVVFAISLKGFTEALAAAEAFLK
ncbi:MAG: invasion associated locus B family protein [Gallionellaceae bacterium]|jgi:invasion protein IalB|nr:invasion associated locus B family protein [Gallionellaceae bacterium]